MSRYRNILAAIVATGCIAANAGYFGAGTNRNASGVTYGTSTVTAIYSGSNLVWSSVSEPPVAGYSLWLDASRYETFTLSGTNITVWADLSGNGYNATNDVPANAPHYDAAAFGSKAGVVFAGGVKTLMSEIAITNQHTCFFVARVADVTKAYSCPLSYYYAGGDLGGMFYVKSDGTSASYPLFNGEFWDGTGAATFTTVETFIYTFTHYGPPGEFFGRKNGVFDESKAREVATVSATALRIGTSFSETQFWDGNIHEVVFYSSRLTTNEIEQVETYLGTKWGVTVTH